MSIFNRIQKRYRAYHYVVVAADFHSEGGAWRSIHRFYKHLDESRIPCLLVDLRRKDGWKQWFCALLFSPQIVVNGMSAVECWHVLLGIALRKDITIYLHDTAYMLDSLQRRKPMVYRFLSHLLKNRLVFCVSEKMESLYRERFGVKRTAVVYEVTETEPEPVFNPEKKHILMVGSLNRRKGYPLFVETAKLVTEHGLPWEFHWVGGLGEADLAPISDAIRWWGWRDSATSIVKQADVFFLSSIDDPQPLACLEAMALGIKVVAYDGTGSSEMLKGLSGCRTYSGYSAESAFQALNSAIGESVDQDAMRSRLREIAGVEAFACRVEKVFHERDIR